MDTVMVSDKYTRVFLSEIYFVDSRNNFTESVWKTKLMVKCCRGETKICVVKLVYKNRI
jgi:hypothetical protein